MAKTDTGPKPARSLEERLEFKELMEILAQDTKVITEFTNALKGEGNSRMSNSEADRVLSFLLTDNPEHAQKYFEEICQDLIKIPSTVEGWAEVREEAVKDIAEIKQLQLDCEKQKALWLAELNAMQTMGNLTKADGTPLMTDDAKASLEEAKKQLQAQLDANDKKMDILTKQISALTLMDAYAKTHEQQLESKARTEEMAPTRKTLKEWWQERSTQYRTMNQDIKQAKKLSDFSRVEKKLHRSWLKDARNHAKQSNKLQSKIDKQEQEIIKRAQKIAMKDFRKNKGILGLKAIARGESLTPPNIETIERASAYLTMSDRAQNDNRLQSMMTNLENLQKVQAAHDETIADALGKLNRAFTERRQEIAELAQNIEHQIENGEIGTMRVGIVNHYLKNGLEEAAIDLDDVYFTDELKHFMHENGFDHMLKGHQFDAVEKGGKDGPEQDEPEIGGR